MTNFPSISALGTNGRVVAARLRPGQDVIKAIEATCVQHGIIAGQITSSIGSLRRIAYNYVTRTERGDGTGYTTKVERDGAFSVLAGQGLVSPGDEPGRLNIHYHAVVSDDKNVITGGHILPGTITLTTMDLFVVEILDVEIVRARDEETGAVITSFYPTVGSNSCS